MLSPSKELTQAGVAPNLGGHIGALDGVRAASILLVLAGHTLPLGFPEWELNRIAARSGMALFFCLSGFLITVILYRNPDPINFMVKRLFRIIPAVYLYMTIVLIMFDLPWHVYVTNLLFLQNYIVDGHKMGPLSHLWSLAVEMHFYIAIGCLVALLGRKALWLIPPAAIIVTGLRIDSGVTANINTHLRADEILAGGCLALITIHFGDRLRTFFSKPWRAWTATVVLSILFLASAHNDSGWLVYFRPYFCLMVVGVLLHCRLNVIHPILESGPARYIAQISYALYIYHPMMIWGWFNSGSLAERYLMKRPISYVLTWIAAHLSTRLWEEPCQRLARRLLQRRAKLTAPETP